MQILTSIKWLIKPPSPKKKNKQTKNNKTKQNKKKTENTKINAT